MLLILYPEAVLQDSLATSASDTTAQLSVATKVVPFQEFFSMSKVIAIIVVLIGTYVANRLITFLLGNLAEKQSSYRLLLKRLVPFLNVLIWSSAIFFIIAGIIFFG